MSKLELILIRHGETDWNKDQVFRGRTDMRLNATGILQADAVAEALSGKVFEAIYSSPLKRAQVTATRIAKPHALDVRVKDDFQDISFGQWEGLTPKQVEDKWPPQYRKWVEKPASARFPGGETPKRAWKRANSGLREILFTHGTGTIVIVSHRIPLKMMTAYLLGTKRKHFAEVRHDPCAMSVFEVEDRVAKPVVLNDTRHLARLTLPEPKDF